MSQLAALKRHSIVVADTGEVDEIRRLRPQDATTNPSLIAKAIKGGDSQELVDDALQRAESLPASERVDGFIDELFVNFGCKILEIIPGRVSTEVAARLSFDTPATIDKARRLIALYEGRGIERERVLIKIATTWEGVRAAEVLEREGIHCNMTLLFSLVQAVACAEAKATLISPFVGRIYDWFKKAQGVDDIPIEEDPGVASVREIYDYLKKFDYPIEVMGASFRKAGQITQLAGCDLLTISPDLLDELDASAEDAPRMLDVSCAKASDHERIPVDEDHFRWLLNEDAMGTEKLAEGIRRFHADAQVLEELAERQLV